MNPRYAVGYEWTNHRGQVFVMQGFKKNEDETLQLDEDGKPIPVYPGGRKDGFVARAKLVMEAMLADGLVEGDSYEDYALCDGKPQPRNLTSEERVYHRDGNAGNDDPTNLMLFPSMKAVASYRSDLHREARDEQDRKTIADYNRMVAESKAKRRAAGLKGVRARQAQTARSRQTGRSTAKANNTRKGLK
jgi:hypothetical protein